MDSNPTESRSGIAIEAITKDYAAVDGRRVQALARIDLAIRDGEFVALIGKSGCGKTTLLNMIAGFVAPSTGRLLLDGEPITGPGRGKGVVFQQFALFPWLTAIKNVAFAARQRGLSKKDSHALASELIDLVKLGGFENKYPFELSGGMQQRVSIARTLALNPKVLLMDEPFGALDEFTRAQLQQEILRIWAKYKKTIVFVTHSVTESVLLADRVVGPVNEDG